jgi:hypothetical protein
VTAPDDEWPIHPDNEWPVRPDPEAEKALYVPPDEADNPAEQPKTQRDWKHTIKVYSVFAGIATLVFGFVYITDMFAGDEVGVIVSYLFTLAIGLLYILIEDEHYASPAYREKLREAKPRRSLISDDQQPIIDMSTHEDRRAADDGSWPVLQRNEPKPKFELYEPDYQYWPHSPLPEKSTVYEKVRSSAVTTDHYLTYYPCAFACRAGLLWLCVPRLGDYRLDVRIRGRGCGPSRHDLNGVLGL